MLNFGKFYEQEKVTRDDLQEFCKSIPKTYSFSLLWTPRTGKTQSALNALSDSERVLILSNTEGIRDMWKEETISKKNPKIKSICYQSLKNETDDYDVVIFDEGDLLTENYFSLIENWDWTKKRFIYLTGTQTFRGKLILGKLKKMVSGGYFEWSIDFSQAISWGILPEPEIIKFKIPLRNKVRDQLFQKGNDKRKKNLVVPYGEHFNLLQNKKVNLQIQCTEQEWIQMKDREIEWLKEVLSNFKNYKDALFLGKQDEINDLKEKIQKYPLPETSYQNMIKRKGLERKNFLADKKNRYIKRLFKYFKVENERVLVFANSIPQAEFIDEECAIHSNIKLKKGEISPLEKFNRNEINKLIAVGMLDRGIKVTNVHTSFILQIPASTASALQKASRNLLDDSPRLVIPFFGNTKDEENVEKFVQQFDEKYIKTIIIDKIE